MHIHSLVIVESSQIDRALISKKVKSISRLKVCVRAQEQGVSKTAEHAMVGGSCFVSFQLSSSTCGKKAREIFNLSQLYGFFGPAVGCLQFLRPSIFSYF